MIQTGISVTMSSGKGGGKALSTGTSDASSKGKSRSEVSNGGDQLSHGMADMNLGAAQNDECEAFARKSKNKAGSSSGEQWSSQNSNPKVSAQLDVNQKLGIRSSSGLRRGNTWPAPTTDSKRTAGTVNARPYSANRGFESNSVVPPSAIPPLLEHEGKWSCRVASTQPDEDGPVKKDPCNDIDVIVDEFADDSDDQLDMLDDSDDEILNDDFDSGASQKSHETGKKKRWFKGFFENLDTLTIEQINEPAREWHCPACKGGSGGVVWYPGLQPLMTHAKTKGSKRVALHRELAELLDEELRRRGTFVVPAGEAFGRWKGLTDTVQDKEIVWPPMVVIMNTKLEKDENDKWLGMGNPELLDYFSSYAAMKARHSYGPRGHRGISILIFEASPVGYLEAERLSKHFEGQGTDRVTWERRRVLFYPGGKRQLYGFMAEKQDLDDFNQHSQGKSKLKFEMRSYEEMVVSPMKQMNEDNQQLMFLKNKVAKEKKISKALEESCSLMTEKYRNSQEEIRIVRQRTQKHYEQTKEEMDYQEQFFKDQIRTIHEDRDAKEDDFEKIHQEEREKVKQSNANLSIEDHRHRAEEIAKFFKFQDKEMEEFLAEKDELINIHEDKMVAMKGRHREEEVELEKEFDAELKRLMEKHTPTTFRGNQH